MKIIPKILLIGILLLVLYNCKKKNKKQPDEIVYSDIRDTTTYSLKTYTLTAASPCEVPIPWDSTSTYDMDVDNDNRMDFRVTVAHGGYQGTNYCGHCPPLNIDIYITPLAGDAFLRGSESDPGTVTFAESEEISASAKWLSQKQWAAMEGCQRPYVQSFGYWGFKVNNRLGWIKVTKAGACGITITGYAINKTAGNSIKAGQVQ